MASKEELLQKNKAELQELAAKRELEGRSGLNKEELAEALADDSSSDESEEEEEAGFSEEYVESRVEAAEDLDKSQKELEEEAEEEGADERFLQPEEERVMTGVIQDDPRSGADADLPEEHVGNFTEAGETEETTERRELARKAQEEGIKQEDVIDFPPPLGEEDAPPLEEKAHSGLLSNTNVIGSEEKTFGQKAQFYTDGLSGAADSNLERAYELPEVLQSNDPVVRTAGDQSEPEGAEKSEEEEADAEEVKSGERLESSE